MYDIEMTPELLEEWLWRLESGAYRQALGALRRTHKPGHKADEWVGYCCVGLLAETAVDMGLTQYEWTAGFDYGVSQDWIFNNSSTSLVLKDDCHGAVIDRLVELNDAETSEEEPINTFKDIARMIREGDPLDPGDDLSDTKKVLGFFKQFMKG